MLNILAYTRVCALRQSQNNYGTFYKGKTLWLQH